MFIFQIVKSLVLIEAYQGHHYGNLILYSQFMGKSTHGDHDIVHTSQAKSKKETVR